MKKQILALTLLLVTTGYVNHAQAQSSKNKKSRYYQNSTNEPEFDVRGYETKAEKNEVDKKPVESEYNVKVSYNEKDGKYKGEKRVIEEEVREGNRQRQWQDDYQQAPREPRTKSYPTTYGTYRTYNEDRNRYDKYYSGNESVSRPVVYTEEAPAPPPAPKTRKQQKREDKIVKMSKNESEYQTTVVKKRYTNLDVLCDDLDLAKVQRPVFKGICTECSHDVDLIIVNKNLSLLEKNYRLKQCYMQRDKRLRETLDDDQYKKFLRIKDADEYLILTKDPELKDGIYK